jgi:glycosyltransferase involved in cell wall biosynthesis
VLTQTFTDFEFILVDNGSPNRAGVICDEYAERDKRISVIHRLRGNIGSGRNTGLQTAKGDFVIFVDDDDTAEPDMLDFLYNLAKRYDADISICGSWYSTDGIITNKFVYDEILELNTEQAIVELLKRKYFNIASAAKMFRRSIIPEHPYSESGKIDDVTTVYKIFAEARKVVAQGIPKYSFHRHEGNLTSFTTDFKLLTPEVLDEYLDAYRKRTIFLSERFPVVKNYFQYTELSYMISMVDKINRYNLTNCGEVLSVMLRELKQNRDAFLHSLWTQEFERQWMKEYVSL